ncbi:MAG: SpoIIE family protein phosphatase [Spirochaetes bacterium]|nr:SpoIIE family protein phosphatase [Spirochaetota bacterium]
MKKLIFITVILFLLYFTLIKIFSGNTNQSGLQIIRGWEYTETSAELKSYQDIINSELKWEKTGNTRIRYGVANKYLVFRTKINTSGEADRFLIIEDVVSSIRIFSPYKLIYASGEMTKSTFRYFGNRTHYANVGLISDQFIYIVVFSPGIIRGINKPVYMSDRYSIAISLIRKIMPVLILTPILIGLGILFLIINIFKQARSLKFFSLGIFLLNLGIFTILDIANKGVFFKNFELLTNLKYFTLFMIPITLHFFVQKRFQLGFTKICRLIAAVQSVFIISSLIIVNSGMLVYNDVFIIFLGLLLFSIIVVVYRIMFVARINDYDSKILILGLFSLLGFALHDVIINLYHVANAEDNLVWGTFTFGLSLVAITLRQIVQMTVQLKSANTELENYSVNLEKEVLLRTEELSKSHDEIEMLYRDVQYTKLLQDNDLELAKNIQRNFLLEEVPECSSWEIAFRYVPAYDVSGDIYDFYTDENGNLSGLALYDVSGHGVSSGLITMVTKIISFQKYKELKASPLNEVISSINETLAIELDKVENYLTGIIMRLHDDEIEYCNCAHPDVLIKKNKTGEVTTAAHPGKKFKNFILGSDVKYEAKPPVFYPVESGDIILLYTDSMYEEKDSENNFYGMNRLIEKFKSVSSSVPDEIIGELISDVLAFSHNNTFHDDCTIICLRKK